MSINVFDVGSSLAYLDHHSLLKSVSEQDLKSFNFEQRQSQSQCSPHEVTLTGDTQPCVLSVQYLEVSA